jgi:hypothetical protein
MCREAAAASTLLLSWSKDPTCVNRSILFKPNCSNSSDMEETTYNSRQQRACTSL